MESGQQRFLVCFVFPDSYVNYTKAKNFFFQVLSPRYDLSELAIVDMAVCVSKMVQNRAHLYQTDLLDSRLSSHCPDAVSLIDLKVHDVTPSAFFLLKVCFWSIQVLCIFMQFLKIACQFLTIICQHLGCGFYGAHLNLGES